MSHAVLTVPRTAQERAAARLGASGEAAADDIDPTKAQPRAVLRPAVVAQVGVPQRRDSTALQAGQPDSLPAPRTDPITGLLNRAGLEASLNALVDSGQAGRGVGAMLCVDLGGPEILRALADQGGFQAVDEALRGAAEVLRRAVRGRDAIGRLGGDDFIIVLEGLGELSNASRIADAVQVCLKQLRLPFQLPIAPRIGVTRLPPSARAIACIFAARELARSSD